MLMNSKCDSILTTNFRNIRINTLCHDTPLGYGQQLCEILSRTNMAVRNYGLQDTDFGYTCTMNLTLKSGDMTLGQGHDTPLGHGQQLFELLSRSEKGVKGYGPDTM